MSRLTRRVRILERQTQPSKDVCPECKGAVETRYQYKPIDVPPRPATYEEWLAGIERGRAISEELKTAEGWCAQVVDGNKEAMELLLQWLPQDPPRCEPPPDLCRGCLRKIDSAPEKTYDQWLERSSRNAGRRSHEEWCALIEKEDETLAEALHRDASDDTLLILLHE